jgi:molecular chaperone Hsp33
MIKKSPYGKGLKEQLLAAAKDRLHHFILEKDTIRGAILHGTRMVHEMRANHELGILETLVLGHAYLGAALMSATLKGNDRLSLLFECSGPIRGLVVESNAFGEVRGYLKQIPIPIEKPLESFDLSPFFGAGFLTVTRYLESAKQPFAGKVILQYGNIAQDLAHYYVTSEQIPTALHLSIRFDPDGNLLGAGGMLIQALPGADAETILAIEQKVESLPSLGTAFSTGKLPETIIRESFKEYAPRIIGNRRIEFMCHCNESDVKRLLMMLPKADLTDILEKGPFPVEMRCHHCNTSYEFGCEVIAEIHGNKP